MAASVEEHDDEITGINVTPLVDITLVLLIIFMVTATYVVKEAIEVDLPRAASGGQTVGPTLAFALDREGKLYLDGARPGRSRAPRCARRWRGAPRPGRSSAPTGPSPTAGWSR